MLSISVDLFDNVTAQNIISFIKESHFSALYNVVTTYFILAQSLDLNIIFTLSETWRGSVNCWSKLILKDGKFVANCWHFRHHNSRLWYTSRREKKKTNFMYYTQRLFFCKVVVRFQQFYFDICFICKLLL